MPLTMEDFELGTEHIVKINGVHYTVAVIGFYPEKEEIKVIMTETAHRPKNFRFGPTMDWGEIVKNMEDPVWCCYKEYIVPLSQIEHWEYYRNLGNFDIYLSKEVLDKENQEEVNMKVEKWLTAFLIIVVVSVFTGLFTLMFC